MIPSEFPEKIFPKIFDAFPPPKFLDIPYAGVAISDSHIHCIKLKRRGSILEVKKFGERDIPSGFVEGGSIERVVEVAAILEDLKKELDLEYIKMSMPEEKAYLFTLEIPKVNKHDIRETIESRIEDNVPLSAAETVFDYTLVDPYSQEDHLDVVVAALPAAVVETYAQVAIQANVSPLSLEIGSQAVIRSVLKKGHTGTTLIAHFHTDKLSLYISCDRVVHFTSTSALKSEPSLTVSEVVLREVDKVIRYWASEEKESHHGPVDLITVCGDVADHSLPGFISAHTGIRARLADVWSNVCDVAIAVPPISFDRSLSYAPAIGLALPMELLI